FFDVLNVADRAGFECFAVHDRGIHLVDAGCAEDRPFASVEKRIVFECAHGGFGRVETRPAMLQDFPAGAERVFDAGPIFPLAFRRHLAALHRSGATVNDQSDFILLHRTHFSELLRLNSRRQRDESADYKTSRPHKFPVPNNYPQLAAAPARRNRFSVSITEATFLLEMAEQKKESREETLITGPAMVLQEIGSIWTDFLREVGSISWFIAQTFQETFERLRDGRVPFR